MQGIACNDTAVSDSVRQCPTRVSHSVTQCHPVSHSVTQCHTVSPSVTQCHTVSHSVTQCHTVSHSVTQCHTVSHSVTQCRGYQGVATPDCLTELAQSFRQWSDSGPTVVRQFRQFRQPGASNRCREASSHERDLSKHALNLSISRIVGAP